MTLDRVPLVQPLSRAEIERRANRLVAEIDPSLVNSPGEFPVLEVLEFRSLELLGAEFDVSDELEPGVEGLMDPTMNTPQIRLSPEVYAALQEGIPRARFTAMHEAGHAKLHAIQLREQGLKVQDGRLVFELYRVERRKLRAFEDPEWQANTFAGCVLMPGPAIMSLAVCGGIQVSAVQRLFGVSYSAAMTRIEKLGLRGY